MSPRRKRSARRKRWYQRLGLISWLLLLLLFLASLSVLMGPWGRARTDRQGQAPQVQVLNGSRVRGLAASVAEHLRDEGLDVVSIGNADSNEYAKTLVLLRRGDMATAYRVSQALGIGSSLEQLDPTLLVDVTIILGADYQVPVGGTAPTDAEDQAVR